MALDNFDNLKASIVAWSKRSDISNLTDDFILIAESEMYNNESAPLRIRAMEARATAPVSISSRFLALPDSFLQMRRLKLNSPFGTSTNDTDLTFYAPEQMPLSGLTQIPQFFTVTTQLEFDSTPDQAYTIEMQYLNKLTALSDAATTNFILTNYPTIYLYGSLWALFQYSMEQDVAEYYYQKFLTAIQGANATDQAGRYGAAPMVRMEGYTP